MWGWELLNYSQLIYSCYIMENMNAYISQVMHKNTEIKKQMVFFFFDIYIKEHN